MVRAGSLSAVFSEAAGHGPRDDAALEAALVQYLTAACAAWPGWELDPLDFLRHVGARCREGRLQPVAHAPDLYLALACARGYTEALAEFQRHYAGVIERMLAYRRASADLAADARQIVQERLLVANPAQGGAPGITQYRGTGPLASWVASSAATTLAMLRRSDQRRQEQRESWDHRALTRVKLDPELDYLKIRYKAAVEEAFSEALGQLGERERTLLRLHFAEQLSLEALALLYAIGRATAARWLARARSALLEATKSNLRSRLLLSDTECNSVVALVRSQLDLSISRLLSNPEHTQPAPLP